MIGRIDSTPNLRRGRHPGGPPRRGARLAALLAVAGLALVAGSATSTSTSLAQTPAAPRKPKATPKGVEPSPAPAGMPEVPPDPGPPPPPVPDQPPPAIGAPGGLALPADEPRASGPRDAQVRPAGLDDNGPLLPGATSPPGGAPPAPGSGQGQASDPFALPPDRMGVGRQAVRLSVEVQASPIINLGKESTVRLVVKNEGNDASGVSLVYQLPDGLKLNSSTPPATPLPGTTLYHWPKPMLAAGSEWAVVLKVVATSTRPCEHAATVTAKTGSRANTIVQEPKLKVEATSSPGRVLKGEPVDFQIAVTNTGTGPARNVTVQAKLSSGLRSLTGDDLVEQTIAEIGPGQRFPLEVLTVDTVAGGKQTCTVDVRSPDVTTVPDEQRVTRDVEVTKPELLVKLEGQAERFTGQTNEYKLTVTNTGTAQAKKVKVVASLPQQGGKLIELPKGAKFDVPTRKLIWSIAQLEPLQAVEMSFVYGTSTPGLYQATAEATSGELRAKDAMTTDVSGIAVLDVQLEQTARVMDVGKTNYYDIKIKNSGTKEATRLQLRGKLAGKLKVQKHYNVEKGEFSFNAETGEFIFPEIERLGIGQAITLSLEVLATESGPAGCKVTLAHAEMSGPDDKVEDVISTTVTGNNRSRAAAARP